jgi:hypothetical protein
VQVHSAEQLERGGYAFKTPEAREAHERRYRNFRSAEKVWRQLSLEDRAYTLGRLEYQGDIDKAVHDDTLKGVKATGGERDRLVNGVKFAQRDPRFSTRYKALQSARPRDVRVRPHEKRLREKGLRRPTAIRAREGAVVSTTT